VKPHWFHILLALADEPRHGSGIMRDVLELTDGELRLWPATLYGSLEDLRELGWIDELDETPAGESDRKRYYRITDAGRATLEREAERLAELAELARRRSAAGGRRTSA